MQETYAKRMHSPLKKGHTAITAMTLLRSSPSACRSDASSRVAPAIRKDAYASADCT